LLSGCSNDGQRSAPTSAPAQSATTIWRDPRAQEPVAVRTFGDRELRQGEARSDAPNVLFISIDDQNDWMGFLNARPGVSTPNCDALARESVNFTSTYAAAPMCIPSRTAMLFGQLPHETGVYDHSSSSHEHLDAYRPSRPSLIDDFWGAGYDGFGCGKIFNGEDRTRWTAFDTIPSWLGASAREEAGPDSGRYRSDWISPYDGEPEGNGERFIAGDVDWGPSGVPLEEEPDMRAAAIARLHLAADHDRPFFLAVGLGATHEPWRVPQRFLDERSLDDVVVPDAPADDLDDLPAYARENLVDPLGGWARIEEAGIAREAVRAFQASTTFMDYCVGTILDALADSRYADDTIVVLFSDNGFHIGEKRHLHKMTLWEPATHVPLLVKAPGALQPAEVDAPVSLVDVGPTLHDLCGVERLVEEHAGASLVPVVDRPESAADRPPVTTWKRGNFAVRREEWRYIRYVDGSTELYDHGSDPDERTNLANDPDHAAVAAELDRFLPEDPGV
jgi:arylsulfatase A-like enzyme